MLPNSRDGGGAKRSACVATTAKDARCLAVICRSQIADAEIRPLLEFNDLLRLGNRFRKGHGMMVIDAYMNFQVARMSESHGASSRKVLIS